MNVFQYDNDIAYSMLILLITVQTLYKSEEQEIRVIWWNLDHPSIWQVQLWAHEIWMTCGNKPELAWFALGLIQNCTQVWSLRFTRNSYFSRYSFISRWLTWLFTRNTMQCGRKSLESWHIVNDVLGNPPHYALLTESWNRERCCLPQCAPVYYRLDC